MQNRTCAAIRWFDVQRTDGAGVAAVDARLAIQNLAADDIGFPRLKMPLISLAAKVSVSSLINASFTAFQASSNLAERACF